MSERLVNNIELAEKMAKAEYPFREIARVALRYGQEDIAEEALSRADTASLRIEDRAYRLTVVTCSDFWDFARRHNYTRQLATQVWNSLTRACVAGCIELKFFEQPPEVYRGVNTRAHYLRTLEVASLIHAVDDIENLLSSGAITRASSILGEPLGARAMQFLQHFAQANRPPASESEENTEQLFYRLPVATAGQDVINSGAQAGVGTVGE